LRRSYCGRSLVIAFGLAICLATAQPARAQDPYGGSNRPATSQFGLWYEYQNFDKDFASWQLGYVELSKKFSFGSVIARLNHAERFGESGDQWEVDAYPGLGKGRYAYLNFGKSSASIFPETRYGAQIYQNLPHGWELSVGMRRLEFTSSNVNIYTGSIGKYRGNYYYTLTPYVTPGNGGTSASGALMMRKYFATADQYLELRGTYGQVPETDILLQERTKLDSWSVFADLQTTLTRNFLLRTEAGYRNEQPRIGSTRKSITVGAGLKWRF
jgi:hypothetical protein